jgi:hypothetical protein
MKEISKYLCDEYCDLPCIFRPKGSESCLAWQYELSKCDK